MHVQKCECAEMRMRFQSFGFLSITSISECSSNKSDNTWDIVWTTFDPFPVIPWSRKEQREHSSKHLSLSPTDETT